MTPPMTDLAAIAAAYRSLEAQTRRTFLGNVGRGLGAGVGSMALASLGLGSPGGGGLPPAAGPRPPHHRPRAKSVISIHLAGSPSQHELFENKPTLERFHGQPCPDEYLKG
jgi:hypothetical protein